MPSYQCESWYDFPPYQLSVKIVDIFFVCCKVIIVPGTLQHNQSTDTPSSDLNHGVLQLVLWEIVSVTRGVRRVGNPFDLQYEYPSAFRSHPIRLRNKYLLNGCYDYGSVLQPFLKHVPGGFPHREWYRNGSQCRWIPDGGYDLVGKPPPKGIFLPAWHCNEW